MGPRKSLCDNYSDSAMEVPCIPVPLFQDFLVERGKAQGVLITVFVDIYRVHQRRVSKTAGQAKEYGGRIAYGSLILTKR